MVMAMSMAIRWTISIRLFIPLNSLSEVAQLVERLAVNQNVGGSNPSLGAYDPAQRGTRT